MPTPIFDSLLNITQTVTGSGNSTAINVDKHPEVQIYVNVKTVTGTTPTLDIAFEGSVDGTTGWTQVVKLPQLTSAHANKMISGVKVDMSQYKAIRAVYTTGGTTPSFAIDVKFSQ